jgi:hypothetical protein
MSRVGAVQTPHPLGLCEHDTCTRCYGVALLARRPAPPVWRVSTVDSGHSLGVVAAETYEEALGKAIRLAARSELPPQALHVQKQEG